MNTQFFFVCCICTAAALSYPKEPPPVVDIPLGRIIGKWVHFNDTELKTFQGIPYAKPPIGQYRFRKPQPVEPWKKPLRANHLPPGCIQSSTVALPWADTLPGKTEDCLYLNVWTPSDAGSPNSKKSVMFWIFGGGFDLGSSRIDLYDGSVMAALGDVIVVTTNFRLGVEGFLYAGIDDAPGNMGLYDVLEALKWVKSNIGSFGGDENSITVFGQSSGAITAGFLLVSPLAKGLFIRAIFQSGSPARLDTKQKDDLRLGQDLASSVGCTSNGTSLMDTPEQVVDCLRGKNPLDLIKKDGKKGDNPHHGLYPRYGDELLPQNPRVSLIKGNFSNIDILIGTNHDEGSTLVTHAMHDLFGRYGFKNPRINKTLGEYIIRQGFKHVNGSDSVVQHYLGNLKEDDYDVVRYQVQTAIGDFRRLCPSVYLAESVASRGNRVLFYLFHHRPSTSPWAPWMGVNHFDETAFVFGHPLRYPHLYQPSELLLSKEMVRIWTYFAKTGKPLYQPWPYYSGSGHYPYTLNTDFKGIGEGPHLENCNFFRPYFGF